MSIADEQREAPELLVQGLSLNRLLVVMLPQVKHLSQERIERDATSLTLFALVKCKQQALIRLGPHSNSRRRHICSPPLCYVSMLSSYHIITMLSSDI